MLLSFDVPPSRRPAGCWVILLRQCWLHLWRRLWFPMESGWLMICDLASPPHTHVTLTPSVHPDMLCKTPCVFLVLVFWGSVRAGPLTDPHPHISDQELFWGSDQYDFSVVLSAAGMNCFWHFAHHGERFYLSFMVRLNVTQKHQSLNLSDYCSQNKTVRSHRWVKHFVP